jgi:hypothetical protein
LAIHPTKIEHLVSAPTLLQPVVRGRGAWTATPFRWRFGLQCDSAIRESSANPLDAPATGEYLPGGTSMAVRYVFPLLLLAVSGEVEGRGQGVRIDRHRRRAHGMGGWERIDPSYKEKLVARLRTKLAKKR